MLIKKKRAGLIVRLLLCAVTIVTAQGVKATAAQAPGPKTVSDFFLLVPERYMPYDRPFREHLLSGEQRGAVIDVRNGYISWDASDAPDAFEFAIFRKSNGGYVVAYNDTGDDFDQEPEARLILLSYEGGRWRDVTKALLPIALDKRLGYKLPREGRSVEVTGGGGRRLYTLTWARDRFRIQRAGRK